MNPPARRESGSRFLIASYPQDGLGIRIVERFIVIFSRLGVITMLAGTAETVKGAKLWLAPLPSDAGVARHVLFQTRLAASMVTHPRAWDLSWFVVGGSAMLLPILAARVLGRKAVLVVTGSTAKTALATPGRSYAYRGLTAATETLSMIFASNVITYGESIVTDLQLMKRRSTVIATGSTYVDTNLFRPGGIPVSTRPAIGYVGRLSPEKGVQSFLSALPAILDNHPSLEAYIVGDGTLRGSVENLRAVPSCAERLRYFGWVDRAELPAIYRKMKFLVLPSSTEGLPNAMLEAMACGTLTIASAVGAVPDLIRDTKNGFLLRGTEPSEIESCVRRGLHTEPAVLDEMSRQARADIASRFSFESAVERYRKIFHVLGVESCNASTNHARK